MYNQHQILQFFSICLILDVYAANSLLGEDNAEVCDNENCKLAADIINRVMNRTVDPCDDFYNYACGGWESTFPLPKNVDVWNIDKITEINAILETVEILEEEERYDDLTPLKYEKWWYRSCMNLDQIEEVGIKPLEDILDYNDGWPITLNNSDWTDDNHDWLSIHQFYAQFKELSSMFFVHVLFDDRNLSKNVLKLGKPGETLYEKLMKNQDETSTLQRYAEFMRYIVQTFITSANKTIPDDQITKDIEDILAFEKKLRMIKISDESEDLEPPGSYMTIEELQEFYDKENPVNSTAMINWLQVISATFKNIKNVTIDSGEEIKLLDKSYFQKLVHLLDETPNRVIVNYIHWKFIASSLKYTNKEIRDVLFQLTTKPDELDNPQERWEECRSDMRLRFGFRYEYLRRHFSRDTRKMAFDVASEMRSEMLDEVEHSAWLDDLTKEETMIKLHAMKWYIGFTNFFPKRELIEHVYDGLTITSNYFENVQNARKFFMRQYLERLRHWRNPRQYTRIDPLMANSSYDPLRNVIVLTAAQLSVPLLHSSLPLSVNYGYMAPTMGQLMSRTMEKEVNTNMYMAPWSSYMGDTYKSYETKTECFLRQYYNYSVGPSTLDQNMYDTIGLKVAYNAFQSSYKNKNIVKLPGLEELSNDQLFFVSFALKYCQAASPKYLADHDPAFHTPNEYRVIGALSNSEYFAKAFSCPVNSPMNPESKCIL